ncbi:MAG: HAMP domain-containing histidine kinase [Candidatus Eremiobacteraeota bacterium]|nr:HAMP domain-containing histidine kinase [Candidatus Eremiobacteraeota bacterium]
MSVRTRFTVTVVTIVAVTVVLFATLSIVALDRALRTGFRDRLRTDAQTIAAAVDVHNGTIAVDPGDLRALAWLHADTPFAVYRSDGTVAAGNAPPAGARGFESAAVAVVRDNREYGHVAVWQSSLWIAEFDRDAALVSLAVGALLIASSIIASRRVARRVLAPLSNIASLAERIESHDLSARLHANGKDELARLCASFDRMLDRLEAAFSRERRFVADASHELRAPLAVVRAETDLALRRDRTTPEYRAALASVEREAARLEELIDELLAAARAEVEAREQQPIDAADLLRDVGERVRAAAATRGMAVIVEAQARVVARANRANLERALLAIVHNAIAYGRAGGTISLRGTRNGAGVTIAVADDGPGFSSEALTHATERFWRGDSARARGGTGLGLAIARTIVEANRGTLTLGNGAGGGAVVTIALAPAT